VAPRPPRILLQPLSAHQSNQRQLIPQTASQRPFGAIGQTGGHAMRRLPRIATAPDRPRPVQPAGKACKRRMIRKQTTLPGLITFRNLRLRLPCTIEDLSGNGARLNLSPASLRSIGDPARLPTEIVLVLPTDRMEVPCEIRWHLRGSIGVRFLGPALPRTETRRSLI